jgi:hypothetical protein
VGADTLVRLGSETIPFRAGMPAPQKDWAAVQAAHLKLETRKLEVEVTLLPDSLRPWQCRDAPVRVSAPAEPHHQVSMEL